MSAGKKAAMLSGFLFPGAGYVFLKKYYRAGITITAASVATYIVIFDIMQRAVSIAEKIQTGEISLDIYLLRDHIANQTQHPWHEIATTVLIICWLVSVIDGYFLGKNRDPLG